MPEGPPRYLVIPAAGLGTRMRIIDPDLPKELLPVGSKPLIQYTVGEGLAADIRDIVIIINHQKEIIQRYFEDRAFAHDLFPEAVDGLTRIQKECSVTFLYQEEPKGESDAIAYARDIVSGHSCAIHYPDNIYFPAPGALKKLKNAFDKYGQDIVALMEVRENHASGIGNSGRVDLTSMKNNVYRIDRLHPKGKGHFVPHHEGELRTCGISISGPHLFDYIERARQTIPEGEFYDVPVRQLIVHERGLLGVRLPGTVFDVGNPIGYAMCLKHLKHNG